MNFVADNSDLSEIIRTYVREGNNYTIYYFDNSKFSYYCDEQTEENRIKLIMIRQAMDRDQSMLPRNIKTTNNLSFVSSILSLVLLSLCVKYDQNNFSPIAIGSLIYSLSKYKSSNKKIRELEKYKMFFELMDKLDVINNSTFLKCIEFDNFYQKRFDIDTLDNYDYSEVKQIYKTIKKSKLDK